MPDARPGSGGGEDTRQPVTLKEYLEKIVDWLKDHFEKTIELKFGLVTSELQRVWDRFEAMQIAVSTFRATNDEWRKGSNEWRGRFDDLSKDMATDTALKATEKSLESQIEALKELGVTRSAALEKAVDKRLTDIERWRAGLDLVKDTGRESKEDKKNTRMWVIAMIALGFTFLNILIVLSSKLAFK